MPGAVQDVITPANFCGVKGFWRGDGSNFGLFHWLASSPLKHSRTTVRVCDAHNELHAFSMGKMRFLPNTIWANRGKRQPHCPLESATALLELYDEERKRLTGYWNWEQQQCQSDFGDRHACDVWSSFCAPQNSPLLNCPHHDWNETETKKNETK